MPTDDYTLVKNPFVSTKQIRKATHYLCSKEPIHTERGYDFYGGGGGVIITYEGETVALSECGSLNGALRHLDSPTFGSTVARLAKEGHIEMKVPR